MPAVANPEMQCPTPTTCPCSDMPATITFDATNQIGNNGCTACTDLNSLALDKVDDCYFEKSITACGGLYVSVSIGSMLTVQVRSGGINGTLLAEWEDSFSPGGIGGTCTSADYAIPRISGDGTCSWPDPLTVTM